MRSGERKKGDGVPERCPYFRERTEELSTGDVLRGPYCLHKHSPVPFDMAVKVTRITLVCSGDLNFCQVRKEDRLDL